MELIQIALGIYCILTLHYALQIHILFWKLECHIQHMTMLTEHEHVMLYHAYELEVPFHPKTPSVLLQVESRIH